MNENGELITTYEAGRRLGCSARTVQRACRTGKLGAAWCGLMGDRVRGVYAASVDALLARRNALRVATTKGGR